MSWELNVWNASRDTLLNTLTKAPPSGVSDGFRWKRRGDGHCEQLEWAGVNARMGIAPRSVVQLKVDGVPQFWGIVPDPPAAAALDAEQLLALGGHEALRVTLLDGAVYRAQGIHAIVRDLLARLCPPALVYDPAAIAPGDGPVLDLYYAPTSDLGAALDTLAKSASAVWWVDPEGKVNFRPASTDVLEVTLAPQASRTLQVQGRETVTHAVLRVLSAASEGASASTYVEAVSERRVYLPATLTSVATSAGHGLYHAEKAFEAPAGVSLFTDSRVGEVSGRDFDDLVNATDGDPESAATSNGELPSISLREAGKRVAGLRVRYTFTPPDDVSAIVHLGHAGQVVDNAGDADDLYWQLPASSAVREMVFVGPPSADILPQWTQSVAEVYTVGQPPQEDLDGNPDTPTTTAPVKLVIYDLALLVINETLAQSTAEGFLHTPAPNPAEVTLGSLITPVPQVSVGGMAGLTALWEYEHSSTAPRTTRIRIGSDGQAGTARAIKLAVQQGRP